MTLSDVLPESGASDAAVATVTAAFVTLLGGAAGLIWAALAPKVSLTDVANGSSAAFHAQIGADAWFLLVGGIAGALCAVIAWLVLRDETPGLAVGLAAGGTLAAVVADRVGYLTQAHRTIEALHRLGVVHPDGSTLSQIDFRIRAIGVLTVWPLAALIVLGLLVGVRSARR